jgi:hypothetical protein
MENVSRVGLNVERPHLVAVQSCLSNERLRNVPKIVITGSVYQGTIDSISTEKLWLIYCISGSDYTAKALVPKKCAVEYAGLATLLMMRAGLACYLMMMSRLGFNEEYP